MSPYLKAIVALVLGALIAGLQAFDVVFGDGVLSVQDIVTIALAVLTPIAVYFAENTPATPTDPPPPPPAG